MCSIKDVEQRLTSLSTEIKGAKVLTNSIRRSLYASVEILRLDFDDLLQRGQSPIENGQIDRVTSQLDDLVSLLKLIPQSKTAGFFAQLDYLSRMIGLFVGFIPAGTIGSLIILFLRLFDHVIGTDTNSLNSELFRRWMARFLLIVAGITVEVSSLLLSSLSEFVCPIDQIEGLTSSTFANNCAILTFSHSSNLDGFLICSSCPIQHIAFAKKELFVV